jgi:hypothetical protein
VGGGEPHRREGPECSILDTRYSTCPGIARSPKPNPPPARFLCRPWVGGGSNIQHRTSVWVEEPHPLTRSGRAGVSGIWYPESGIWNPARPGCPNALNQRSRNQGGGMTQPSAVSSWLPLPPRGGLVTTNEDDHRKRGRVEG